MMSDSELIIFPWNQNFETGIKEVDEQHHHLFMLVNKLANTLIYDNPVEVDDVFKELSDYATYHFSCEENVWGEYLAGDLWDQQHKESHGNFVDQIQEIKTNSKSLDWQQSIEFILHFLIRWLAFHILGDDKKMSIAVKEMANNTSIDQAKVIALKEMKGVNGLLTDTILNMYFEVSTQSIALVREKHRRFVAERELKKLNEKLQKLAITDELSGLFNRRYFNIMMPETIAHAKDERSVISFVSIDLDHFKLLNDVLGHVKGDEAIKKVSDVLTSQFNDLKDSVFRMGGEEFLAVVVNADHEDVISRAELTRQEISNVLISNESTGLKHALTSSIGVFSHSPSSNEDAIYFLEKVDQCLYKAKLSGRNIVISESNLESMEEAAFAEMAS